MPSIERLEPALLAVEGMLALFASETTTLPACVRSCLNDLSTCQQPKRICMPTEHMDRVIEAHAKKMEIKCKKCADHLRSFYEKMEDNKLSSGLQRGEPLRMDLSAVPMLCASRKSQHFVWLQLPQQPGACSSRSRSQATSKPSLALPCGCICTRADAHRPSLPSSQIQSSRRRHSARCRTCCCP